MAYKRIGAVPASTIHNTPPASSTGSSKRLPKVGWELVVVMIVKVGTRHGSDNSTRSYPG